MLLSKFLFLPLLHVFNYFFIFFLLYFIKFIYLINFILIFLSVAGSVAVLTEDFSQYLLSLTSSSLSSSNKSNPPSVSPTSHTSPPPLDHKSPSQSSLSSQSSILPEILEEAGTEAIAYQLTDSVVGLVPKNQKKVRRIIRIIL